MARARNRPFYRSQALLITALLTRIIARVLNERAKIEMPRARIDTSRDFSLTSSLTYSISYMPKVPVTFALLY